MNEVALIFRSIPSEMMRAARVREQTYCRVPPNILSMSENPVILGLVVSIIPLRHGYLRSCLREGMSVGRKTGALVYLTYIMPCECSIILELVVAKVSSLSCR